jgi:hypothetical protein
MPDMPTVLRLMQNLMLDDAQKETINAKLRLLKIRLEAVGQEF